MAGERIRIIGVGNPLMSDDGLGIAAIRWLEKQSLPASVELIDGGCGGLKLLPWLGDCSELILIDAADFGAEPGTHKQFRNADLAKLPTPSWRQSGHNFSLPELLFSAQQLNQLPPFCLHLLQIKSCRPGTHLSPELESALTKILPKIIPFQQLPSNGKNRYNSYLGRAFGIPAERSAN